jgi:hypothetical protein
LLAVQLLLLRVVVAVAAQLYKQVILVALAVVVLFLVAVVRLERLDKVMQGERITQHITPLVVEAVLALLVVMLVLMVAVMVEQD